MGNPYIQVIKNSATRCCTKPNYGLKRSYRLSAAIKVKAVRAAQQQSQVKLEHLTRFNVRFSPRPAEAAASAVKDVSQQWF